MEQWNETRPSPIGFRNWESGVYKPAAKGFERLEPDGLVGGFDAQKESGRAAEFGNTFVNDNGFTTPTLTLTFNLGEINNHPDSFFNLMVADGSVSAAFKAFNMRFWIDSDSVFRDKGYQPSWWYIQQSGWSRNLTLSSGTAGALPLPSSIPDEQNIFVNGDEIFSSGSYRDEAFSNFIYVAGEFPAFPSGYELGTYGGLGASGFKFKLSYEWTGIDARTRVTDTQPCLQGSGTTPDIPTPPGSGALIASGLQDDVQAYWNLDESSGTRVDGPGTLDLAETGTVGQNATGGPDGGPCAVFDGDAGDYLSVSDSAILSVGDRDYTWVGWVYFDNLTEIHVPMAKYTVTGNQREYLFDWINGDNELRFLTTPNGTSDFDNLRATSATISAATWHFVVIWHDESSAETNIQVDNGAIDTLSIDTDGIFDGSTEFRLGSFIDDTSRNLIGRLAKWGIFHRVLSGEEKAWLYNSGAGRDYPFFTP